MMMKMRERLGEPVLPVRHLTMEGWVEGWRGGGVDRGEGGEGEKEEEEEEKEKEKEKEKEEEEEEEVTHALPM